MQLGRMLVTSVLTVLLAAGLGAPGALAAPTAADDPGATTLTLTGRPVHAGESTPLQVDLVQAADQAPVAGAQVLVERRSGGAWTQVGLLTTDDAGHASLAQTLARDAADNVFRATYAGDATHAAAQAGPVQVALVRRASRLVVGGPGSVVDERQVVVRVRWSTGSGDPVAGPVRLMRRAPGGDWTPAATLRTGQHGTAEVSVRPRTDTRWKAVVRATDWLDGAVSAVHQVDNLPPGTPVDLPGAAPRPRVHVPAQAHAAGAGADPRITRIPDGVWSQMTGVTWHSGCPVGRAQLRLLRINYWDYQGYRRRGELVANADAVGQMAGALGDMYAARLPIRSMYREDRFGWSARVHGGDDFASMAAGNTSAFNCRSVVNKPGVRSPHSYGRALDLNTWENPYRSAGGTVPNRWWQPHSHPRVAWRSSSHRVVAIMARHGLRWTYGLGDTQHFDAVGGGKRAVARLNTRPLPCDGVCE
ncbi:MAG: M15 family metallopeptidase [Nocardioides sp.]